MTKATTTGKERTSPWPWIFFNVSRVRRESEWMEAERVIREIRSYEFGAPPRLQSAVCDDCAETILSRRAFVEPVAA
jgi:hypothetical protein